MFSKISIPAALTLGASQVMGFKVFTFPLEKTDGFYTTKANIGYFGEGQEREATLAFLTNLKYTIVQGTACPSN